MKKIYKIKKNKNKYTIILNDNTSFSFYSDTLIKYNLLKPRIISDKEFEEIINYNNYIEAYNVALKYLTIKLRTKKEVEIKLNEYSKDVAENVINKLEKMGYLNEIKYIEAFINDQITLGNKGPVYIIKELEKLGIDNSLILEEINKIDEYIWIEKVKKIIEKRKKSNKLSKKMFVLKTKATSIGSLNQVAMTGTLNLHRLSQTAAVGKKRIVRITLVRSLYIPAPGDGKAMRQFGSTF